MAEVDDLQCSFIHLEPWRFHRHRRTCIHLPGIPSGRHPFFFVLLRSCPLGASTLTWGCWHHPLLSLSNFNIIDKDPSQVTREAKEAIHIWRLDPNLNRNIGKMSIPHCFDPLLGVKPKHPHVDLLSQAQEPVDETAPLSQNTRPKPHPI